MKAPAVDNNTYEQKVSLRVTALQQLGSTPVVMETHGGIGDVYAAVYRDVVDGVVFEKQADRAAILANQRPTWSIYEADCVPAVKYGAGKHLTINLLDVDPYGSCWPVIDAFFSSKRPFAERMMVVGNDGTGHKLRVQGGWQMEMMEPYLAKYGNHKLWELYPDVAEEILTDLVAQAGYEVTFWDRYRCGVELKMLHFVAVLERSE